MMVATAQIRVRRNQTRRLLAAAPRVLALGGGYDLPNVAHPGWPGRR